MRKAAESDADVLCFDLEDAVTPARRADARTQVRTVLTDPAFQPAAEMCVRLTATEPAADLDVLLGSPETEPRSAAGSTLDAVMLPKVESAKRVKRVASLCRSRGLDPAVFALIETAAGVLSADAIADAASTEAVVFGAEDLTADIGATRTTEGTEVLYAREHVVLAASAADIDAIDTVYTDFSDVDGLREEARFARTLGYDGKLAIHPAQIEPINSAFTPDSDEIAWAQAVLAARTEAAKDDRAVFQVDGEMIDAPLIAQAEQIVRRAATAGLIDTDERTHTAAEADGQNGDSNAPASNE